MAGTQHIGSPGVVIWGKHPQDHDYPAAASYLGLLTGAEEVDTLLAPHRSFLDELHPALARHRLLLSPAVQLSLEATPCVGGWAIAKVDPTLRWAHPDVVLSASDERDTALALEVCRRASTLSVEPDGALLLDGRRWRKGLFVPFGETPRTAPRRPRVGSPEP